MMFESTFGQAIRVFLVIFVDLLIHLLDYQHSTYQYYLKHEQRLLYRSHLILQNVP